MFPVKGETLDPTKFRRFMPRGESAIFNWYDGPRPFVLFDNQGQLHLAHWLMGEGRLWRYVAVPTDIQHVSEIVANRACTRRLLDESASVFVVDVDVHTPNGDVAWVWRTNIADIPEDCLPTHLPKLTFLNLSQAVT